MRIKGKIAVWFYLILIGGNAAVIYGFFDEELTRGDVAGLLFTLFLLDIICLPMVIRNYVEIEDGKLTLVLGFGRDSMKIEDITEVYGTHNPIAAGALSLDRVVIRGKRQEMMISVCDKERLFHELKLRNPAILIKNSH